MAGWKNIEKKLEVSIFFFLERQNDDVKVRLHLELRLKHLIACQKWQLQWVLQTGESVIKIASDHKIKNTILNWPLVL